MSSAPTAVEIARDARWLTQALDPAASMVRLIEMTPEAYRSASFLDDRMLQQPVNAHVLPWSSVQQAIGANARRDARWIFHIGHVGSTLLARMLGELPGVLAVREPRLLRDLATIDGPRRRPFAETATALFSRSFAAEEIALVKATSFVSEMAAELVPPGARALFMYAAPRVYIASILAGENSLQETRLLAPNRSQRSSNRIRALPPPRSDADLAAAAWACEMTALTHAAEQMPDRQIEWMDFDLALARMPAELARAASLFGFEASSSVLEGLAGGPLVRRYSKAPEHEYSPDLRRQLIEQEIGLQGPAIDDALAMLARAAEDSPLLARALDRAQAEG